LGDDLPMIDFVRLCGSIKMPTVAAPSHLAGCQPFQASSVEMQQRWMQPAKLVTGMHRALVDRKKSIMASHRPTRGADLASRYPESLQHARFKLPSTIYPAAIAEFCESMRPGL